MQYYKLRLLTELKKVDTLCNTKDSLVINYWAEGNLLLKTLHKYYEGNCLNDSATTHYNTHGLIEFVEHWTQDYGPDTTDGKPFIFCYRSSYWRYEYDSLNRVTKYVHHLSTPYTRRILYTYNNKGIAARQVFSIYDTDFWE